ncbi:hypothetical protein [Streptomyces milbemycinicus]|uniref:Uncharacterized protein n=1 Tax=Streptomyces milbemycinicus TaxID=476552 RepID=A0ABW8LFP3_9ACTN
MRDKSTDEPQFTNRHHRPADIARIAVDGIAADAYEIVADDVSNNGVLDAVDQNSAVRPAGPHPSPTSH